MGCGGLRKKGEGEKREGRERERETGVGGGEKVTETNAPALTAVLHFLTDRCKIEEQKSNESQED